MVPESKTKLNMKIFYNKKEGIDEIQEIISPEYKAPVNFIPADSLINAGEHVFNFVILEDIAKGILAAAIWEEVIRKAFRYLKKKNKDSNDTLVITTDEYKIGKFHKTICFVFYARQSEQEILKGLKKIKEARKRLLHLLELVDIKYSNNTVQLIFKK